MNQKSFIPTWETSFLFYFWSVSVLGFGTVFSLGYPRLIDILFVLGLAPLVLQLRSRLNSRFIFLLILLLILFFLQFYISSASYSSYISLFFRVACCFLVILYIPSFHLQSLPVLKKILRIVVVFFGVANIIIGNILNGSFSLFEIQRSGYFVETFLFLFNRLPYATFDVGNLTIYRNQAIFSEPGFFACVCLLYLYSLMIADDVRSLSHLVLPVVVILSTFSTTGFIGIGLIFFSWVMRGMKSQRGSKKLGLLLLSSALSIPLVILLSFSYSYRIEGDGAHSYQYRLYDLISGYSIAFRNPFLGIGYDPSLLTGYGSELTLDASSSLELVSDFSRGNSNGLAQVAIYFGLPAFVAYLCMIYSQQIFPGGAHFFFLYVLILSSQPILAVYFNLLIVASCFFGVRPAYLQRISDHSV
jgi:hypothetical protein